MKCEKCGCEVTVFNFTTMAAAQPVTPFRVFDFTVNAAAQPIPVTYRADAGAGAA